MEIKYTFNTDNPLDCHVLQILKVAVSYIKEDENQENKAIPVAPKTETKTPAKKDEAEPKKKAAPKKRKPKEKSKEALKKLDLAKMIEYIKSRGDASLVECRILAKHYNDEYGEHESLLTILHNLGSNNFEDLPDEKCKLFAGAVIKLVEDKTPKGEPEKDDDIFGL
jgi:hypothetical protein